MGVIDCSTYRWGDEIDAVGPLGIDYEYVDNCLMPGNHSLVVAIMFLWVLLLIDLLANTAENYFTPTLGCICDKLQLAYDVAGITFLAFGNGAPDFFSLVASVSEGIDILVSVGALLGGSVFICTIVVGTIAIVCPCEVSARIFYRDVAFYIVAAILVSITASLSQIGVLMPLAYIAMYIFYVLFVLFAPYLLPQFYGKQIRSEVDSNAQGISMKPLDGSAVQTAFWHRDAEGALDAKRTRVSYNLPSHPQQTRATSSSSLGGVGGGNDTTDGKGGYTFLILDDDDEDNEGDDDQPSGEKKDVDGDSSSNSNNNNSSNNKNKKVDLSEINLSGGFAPEFELIIHEDHYAPDAPTGSGSSEDLEGGAGTTFNPVVQSSAVTGRGATELRQSLLSSVVGNSDDEDDSSDEVHDINISSRTSNNSSSGGSNKSRRIGSDRGKSSGDLSAATDSAHLESAAAMISHRAMLAENLKARNNSRYKSLLTTLYWQQWLLRRRFHTSIFATEWSSYSIWYKIYYLAEYPFTFLRDLTIPTLDDSNWTKPYAVAHPIASSLFVAFLFGYIGSSVGPFPVPLICLLAGSGPSFAIYLLTHNSRAPKDRIFSIVWTLSAFFMCIVWIYLLAGELVTCLTALGSILNVPPAFLGLTVLAWGNSMGDYCTNFAVARQGLGEMAIAGCYGGPVFNILMGLGAALLLGAWKAYPSPYRVDFDSSCIISIVFLFVALISTLIIVTMKNFKIERQFGIFLISLYVVYTVCQTSFVFLF